MINPIKSAKDGNDSFVSHCFKLRVCYEMQRSKACKVFFLSCSNLDTCMDIRRLLPFLHAALTRYSQEQETDKI